LIIYFKQQKGVVFDPRPVIRWRTASQPALPSELKNGHLRKVLITISWKARFEELKIEKASTDDLEDLMI